MAHRTIGKLFTATLLASALGLAACGEPGPGAGKWFREAGAQLDTGEFGNATMRNMIAQVCFPNGRVGASGTKIGAAPGDPVVALDPSSTPRNPIVRVHCDGDLDGKYARVIYSEYVESATQEPVTEEADAE